MPDPDPGHRPPAFALAALIELPEFRFSLVQGGKFAAHLLFLGADEEGAVDGVIVLEARQHLAGQRALAGELGERADAAGGIGAPFP